MSQIVTFIGKSVQKIAKLRGGGSALPGLVVEKISPHFLSDTLSQLPHGVVIISGTNGKTTTTKMVVELLEGQGLRVFTNRTGSNFTRGVVAALLEAVDAKGNLHADIAVLELDEAYAVRFAQQVAPHYCLLLNVLRDQLDRFGEIDHTADLLHQLAEKTTEGIVINRDDPRLSARSFTTTLHTPIATYGVGKPLLTLFPSDDMLHGGNQKTSELRHDDCELKEITPTGALVSFGGSTYPLHLNLKGVYNIQNAIGAIALTRLIMKQSLNIDKMIDTLSHVRPAFGRGETITVDGQPCELVLVKNPSGFRLGLQSFSAKGNAIMIAINDNYADGRDMSWLWDVDFASLQEVGVSTVTGIRAYDMALRLQYDEIPFSIVETSLKQALAAFIKKHPDEPKRIYCTYTAMLALRRELGRYTKEVPTI